VIPFPYQSGGAGRNRTPVINGDPLINNVQALLHFNDADESTTFTDQIGHGFAIQSGTPAIDSAQSKFGSTSLRLSGSTDKLTSTTPADFVMSGAWAVEFWLYLTALPGAGRTIVELGQSPGAGIDFNTFWLYTDASNALAWYNGSNSGTTSYTLVTDTWVHIAASRAGAAGSALRVFADGALVGSSSVSGRSATGCKMSMGNGALGNALACWIDDFRFTAGAARYTAAFTPPTEQFSDE